MVGDEVQLSKEAGRVVREPNLSGFILPDEDSQRQVEPDGLLALHQRRSRLRVAEDQDLGWTKRQTDLLGFSGVIDVREEMDSFLHEQRLYALDGVGNTVCTRQRYKTLLNGRCVIHFSRLL